MSNEHIRRVLYAIVRSCDQHNLAFDVRLARIKLEVDNALTALSQEIDEAIPAQPERNYEPDGDVIFA